MGQRPPFETFKGATCRGSYALGSACGHCERRTWEREQMQAETWDTSALLAGVQRRMDEARRFLEACGIHETLVRSSDLPLILLRFTEHVWQRYEAMKGIAEEMLRTQPMQRVTVVPRADVINPDAHLGAVEL